MKKQREITAADLNCRGNEYIDHIEGEQWKTLDEYPSYIISNMGRVFSKNVERILKYFVCPYKKMPSKVLYPLVKLQKQTGEYKDVFIHRIVALAFIDNPENKPQIHHLDKDPMNARADNLLYVTPEEHKKYHEKKG